MPPKKRVRKKLTQDQSDGEVAWKHRYIDLYDCYLDFHDKVRLVCGLLSLGNQEDASRICGDIVAHYEKEERELLKC